MVKYVFRNVKPPYHMKILLSNVLPGYVLAKLYTIKLSLQYSMKAALNIAIYSNFGLKCFYIPR